jgi:hypothetical protein
MASADTEMLHYACSDIGHFILTLVIQFIGGYAT